MLKVNTMRRRSNAPTGGRLLATGSDRTDCPIVLDKGHVTDVSQHKNDMQEESS